MGTWMWGGDGIHSLESVRAMWEVGWGKKLVKVNLWDFKGKFS